MRIWWTTGFSPSLRDHIQCTQCISFSQWMRRQDGWFLIRMSRIQLISSPKTINLHCQKFSTRKRTGHSAEKISTQSSRCGTYSTSLQVSDMLAGSGKKFWLQFRFNILQYWLDYDFVRHIEGVCTYTNWVAVQNLPCCYVWNVWVISLLQSFLRPTQ